MSEGDEQKVLSKVPHIYRSQYIQLPEHSEVAITDHQLHYGKQWYDEREKIMSAHYFLALSGLRMPTIKEFMTYRKNVGEARADKLTLEDLNGSTYEGERLRILDERLTSNCWTWLNARFVPGSGFQGMDLERVVGVYEDGTLETQREQLLPCVWKDCYVRLETLNSQGLPQEKMSEQRFIAEETIIFYHPRLNSVARFYADSDGAGLYCDGYPSYSSYLGVFACAKGAGVRPKNEQVNDMKKGFIPQATDIVIDDTNFISAETPESYRKKVAIVEALEGREDLSDREVEEIRRILRKEQSRDNRI